MTDKSPQNFRADLHCHTTCSDGSETPEELIRIASQAGLKGLSITDHDSIEAYKTALPIAQKLGIEMISGVEFSSVHKNVSVHVLAYSFSLKNPAIHAFCQKHLLRREKRNQEILTLLEKHKMPISHEEILEMLSDSPNIKKTIGRPHIAQVMVKKKYVLTVEEAFKKYLGDGKPCFFRGEQFSIEETLEVIHQSKGLAIIAHPHLIERSSTIKQLLEMNFDGLEAYYAKFPPKHEQKWVRIAQFKKWLATGGSDFHGTIKPHIQLGCSWVREETFRILQSHYLKNESLSNHETLC